MISEAIEKTMRKPSSSQLPPIATPIESVQSVAIDASLQSRVSTKSDCSLPPINSPKSRSKASLKSARNSNVSLKTSFSDHKAVLPDLTPNKNSATPNRQESSVLIEDHQLNLR